MDKTYKNSVKIMWWSAAMFAYCWMATLKKWWHDTIVYYLKHWVFFILTFGTFINMAIVTMQARVERENLNQKAYKMEQSIDSLKIVLDR